jgi:hypothetical protein
MVTNRGLGRAIAMIQRKTLASSIRTCCGVVVVIGLMSVFDVVPAQAQGTAVGPAPGATPTLSPYLGLLRSRSGVLPNYQQFVRPQIQLRSTLSRQQRAIDLQSRSIRAVDRRVSTLRDPRDSTTGVRSGFRQYSTFYPALSER